MQVRPAAYQLHALVHREPSGNWVMSWPDGFAYDFWTDRDAAERAAEQATLLIERHGAEHPEVIDEALRAAGALGRARVRRRLASGTYRKPIADGDSDDDEREEAEPA